jgi:hypothetical protein
MSNNKKDVNKIKKLKQTTTKVEFNIEKLKNNEKLFNINKHRRQLKNNTKNKIKNR